MRTAQEQLRQATVQLDAAKTEQQKALNDLGQAQNATTEAKTQQKLAEDLAEKARTEAARQSEIALSRQRANQSQVMLQRIRPVWLTVFRLRSSRWNARTLRESLLWKRPGAARKSVAAATSLGPAQMIEGPIDVTAFSPDGKHLAVLSRTGSSDGRSVLRVITGTENREIASLPREWHRIALSNDARRISISNGRTVKTREISGKGRWELKVKSDRDHVSELALSPNGKYLALIKERAATHDIPLWHGFAEVWEVETGKFVALLQTDTLLIITSVAFSANGQLLAIGGCGDGPSGKLMGRALGVEPS